MPSTNDKIDDNDDEEQPTQQSSWERAVRFGLSVVALPWIVTLRDLGIAQHVRLPHEIYHNLPAGAQDRNASALPEIPTMHVFGSDSSNIEAPLTGGASEGDEDIESGSEC